MSFVQQHKLHPSTNSRENKPFFRPSALQMAKATKENSIGKDIHSDIDSGIKLNGSGEQAFAQPQQTVQARMTDTSSATSQSVSPQVKNETGMPEGLRSGLENLSGENLSGVRVHRNSSKPEAIQAHAYAQGQDIHLAPGQEKHLPHEGWHVVQQMQGRVKPTLQKKDALINDDANLEKEADVMGQRAVQMKSDNASAKPENAGTSSNNGIIQRAMKFEYQFYHNKIKRDNGINKLTGKPDITTLPRKFGPRDYLVMDSSGARLENETKGQIEFETEWEKKWPNVKKQVEAVQDMSKKMQSEPETEPGSDGKMYRKFPASWDIQHLQANTAFPVSSENGRWNASQKDGDAIVKSSTDEYENFRSTAVYDKTGGNLIGTIQNGEKVFVHFKSSDGKWSRIEYKGTVGWMWSLSLTGMESKRFEQNNSDGDGNLTDKPLKSGSKLLVEVNDPSWAPYIQVSESFELEQFESYLEDYETSNAAVLIPDAKSLLLDNNPELVPNGETQTEKDIRENIFLDNHKKLKNLILMVTHYIKQGKDNSTGSAKDPGSAKFAFDLMNRTHFGSIFKSMTEKEQLLFTELVTNNTKGIIPKMGLTTTSLFFVDGTATGYNPKVYDWLISITTGGDILSSQSKFGSKLPGAMGKYDLAKEKGMQKGLIRYEARTDRSGNVVIDDLDDHALKHFTAASTNRKRPTGKNETGLEP